LSKPGRGLHQGAAVHQREVGGVQRAWGEVVESLNCNRRGRGERREIAETRRESASRLSAYSPFSAVKLMNLPLFPTAVIGSLRRPPWLLDRLEEYLAGRLSRDEWERACDQAVPFAIALQETAGIDIVTDGEWRREGYFQVFYERVAGFRTDLIPGRTRLWP